MCNTGKVVGKEVVLVPMEGQSLADVAQTLSAEVSAGGMVVGFSSVLVQGALVPVMGMIRSIRAVPAPVADPDEEVDDDDEDVE